MKTILITGSSRGIGRGIALSLKDMPYRFAIHYHEQKAMAEAVCQEILQSGRDAAVFQADLRQAAHVERLFDEIEARFGTVDILINNAGIASYNLITDETESSWTNLQDLNVNGMFRCLKRAIPPMVSKKAGTIINMSSIWGIIGGACEVSYSASKGAIIAMSKSLAKELGPSGIRVNVIAPGAVNTAMIDVLTDEEKAMVAEATPLGRVAEPEDVAAAVRYLLSPGGDYLTGQVISPNGGFAIF